MIEHLQYIIDSIPLIIALVIWAVRLEKRLTRIETNITWMIKEMYRCPQFLEKHTD